MTLTDRKRALLREVAERRVRLMRDEAPGTQVMFIDPTIVLELLDEPAALRTQVQELKADVEATTEAASNVSLLQDAACERLQAERDQLAVVVEKVRGAYEAAKHIANAKHILAALEAILPPKREEARPPEEKTMPNEVVSKESDHDVLCTKMTSKDLDRIRDYVTNWGTQAVIGQRATLDLLDDHTALRASLAGALRERDQLAMRVEKLTEQLRGADKAADVASERADQAENERDQLAAVVEQVRTVLAESATMDVGRLTRDIEAVLPPKKGT